jgi:hypothetical protein
LEPRHQKSTKEPTMVPITEVLTKTTMELTMEDGEEKDLP